MQAAKTNATPTKDRDALREAFANARALTENLVEPLTPEDAQVSATEDTSPVKWHLAHTTWFFEKFFLESCLPGYKRVDPSFDFLFNSYYQALGRPILPKTQRSLITRPSYIEVLRYRASIDDKIKRLLETENFPLHEDAKFNLKLGINHEQQHQELLLMDIKRNFFANPKRPQYRTEDESIQPEPGHSSNSDWVEFPGGFAMVGAQQGGFSYDIERPRSRFWLKPFLLAALPVSNSEFAEFVEEGGYGDPFFWLANGWDWICRERVTAPLYWEKSGDNWIEMTLYGMKELNPQEPVVHISYYEADAYARWKGVRLPTEQEWESAAGAVEKGQFLDANRLHPNRVTRNAALSGMHGGAWEWTSSSFSPYPGFSPFPGALSEYNGKFQCNQIVAKGGSCVTPREHYRASYRNFFYPHMRWQFCGIRLAKDLP